MIAFAWSACGSAIASQLTMGLLKGLDPLLTADLLHVLRSMGHGDRLCVCDCNFPASQVATETVSRKHIILTVTLKDALNAICSVMPLDFFHSNQAIYMAPQEGVEMPPAGKEVIDEASSTIRRLCGDVEIEPVDRFSFYEQAKGCYAVIQTMERKPYGNIILYKGCVGPDGKDLKP